MAKIKLIIFDAGDVLFESGMKNFNKMYLNFLKKHNKEHLFERSNKLWSALSKKTNAGKISQFEANKLILIRLGIDPKHTKKLLDQDKKLLHRIKISRSNLQVLEKLRKDGYKLAILTDVVHPKPVLIKLFRRLQLYKHTDSIFFSNVIGYSKPHRKSYITVMSHFHAIPSETVFVGHSKDEITGARRLGITTVKLSNENVSSDYEIDSLSALPRLMTKI